MNESSFTGVEPWVFKQVLAFFNRAQTASVITEAVLDDPEYGSQGQGYGIGETVAQRILDHKMTLRTRTYREWSELEAIDGLGPDKLRDLVYTFRFPAADVFVKSMYKDVILDNWQLEHHSRHIPDLKAFRSIATDERLLREQVEGMLADAAEKKFGPSELNKLAGRLLQGTYLDRYEEEDMGRFAWALWFYRVDSDNWFSFDRVREVIEKYLGAYYWHPDDAIHFHLFRGFRGEGIWRSSTGDLPVTVNYAEQQISIWRAELFD